MNLVSRLLPLCVVLAHLSCGSDVDSVRRITVAELRQAIDAGTAMAVDVRTQHEFKLGHIKGAANMPLSAIRSMAAQLPLDKLIVTYCA